MGHITGRVSSFALDNYHHHKVLTNLNRLTVRGHYSGPSVYMALLASNPGEGGDREL